MNHEWQRDLFLPHHKWSPNYSVLVSGEIYSNTHIHAYILSFSHTLSATVTFFQANISIILCLCNPGIRQRHWNQMSHVIGFDITPNSGSSLRKVLRLNLNRFMDRLEAISIAATREHTLELTLKNMKLEWEIVEFKMARYR
jgi:dynein heavy chain